MAVAAKPNFLKPAFDPSPRPDYVSPHGQASARRGPADPANDRVRSLEREVVELQAVIRNLKKQLVAVTAAPGFAGIAGKQGGNESTVDADVAQWDLATVESEIKRIDADAKALEEARAGMQKRLLELKCAEPSPKPQTSHKNPGPEQKRTDPYKSLWEKLKGDAALQRNKGVSQEISDLVGKSASKFEDGHIGFWQQSMIYKTQTFSVLAQDAAGGKELFDRLIMEEIYDIDSELNQVGKQPLMVHLPGTKGAARGEKKCAVKYGGDVSQMSDVVRGTIAVTGSVDDLYRVVRRFVSSRRFQTRLAHFTFFADRYQSPLGDYRDILTLLRIAGFVCELQFNLEAMVAVKESAGGHGHYEHTRLINDNLLMALMRNSQIDAIEAYNGGAKPDVRECIHGMGTLHFAAFHNSMHLLRKLLERGADPYAADQYGIMPIYHAVLKGHEEVAKMLTEHMVPKDLLSKLTMKSGPPFMWCAEIATDMGLDEIKDFLQPIVEEALDHSVLEVREAAANALGGMGEIGKRLASKRQAVLNQCQAIRDGTFLEDRGFSDLKPFLEPAELDELDLSEIQLTPDIAPVIGRFLMKCRTGNLSGQKRLFARAEGCTGLVEGLGDGSLARLETLNLSGCHIAPEAAISLGSFLAKCPNKVKLEGLCCTSNCAVFGSAESLVALGAGLGMGLRGFEGLDLTRLGDFRPSPKLALQGFEDLGRLLSRCPALAEPEGLEQQVKHLLSSPDHLTAFLAGLGDAELRLEKLDVRLPLEKLDLRKAPISVAEGLGRLLSRCPSADVKGVEEQARRLVSSPERLTAFLSGLGDTQLKMEKLDLKHCKIAPEAAVGLGRLLARCSALKSLNLTEHSWLFSAAAPLNALLKGLGKAELSQLESLCLFNSDIAPEAAAGLGKLLKRCPALTKLHLWDNPRFFQTPAPTAALVAELDGARNLRLEYLDVEDCDVSIETKQVLQMKFPRCEVSEGSA